MNTEAQMAQDIAAMEARLDAGQAALDALEAALARFAAQRADMAQLASYYGSGAWRAHFEADEAGRLPAGLKRGVLSEDALYNFLQQRRETLHAMQQLAADVLAHDAV